MHDLKENDAIVRDMKGKIYASFSIYIPNSFTSRSGGLIKVKIKTEVMNSLFYLFSLSSKKRNQH